MMICTCQNLFKDVEGEIEGRKYKCDICGKNFVLPADRAEKADKMPFLKEIKDESGGVEN